MIHERKVALAGMLPAVEMWNENRFALLIETPSGWHLELLSYPGKREEFAPTEREARRVARSFLSGAQ